MPPLASVRWSGRTFGQGDNGWTAHLEWDVVNAPSQTAALQQSIITPGVGAQWAVPARNSPHPETPYLRCNNVVAKDDGLLKYIVAADYIIPPGGQLPNKPTNPLLVPPSWSYEDESSEEPTDTLLYNQAFRNSAMCAFGSGATIPVSSKVWVYHRNEPAYNGPFYAAFDNTVNLNPFNLPGFGLVNKGEALCCPIKPLGTYDRNSVMAQTEIRLKIRRSNGDFDRPWSIWITDQGKQAWGKQTDSKGKVTTGIVDILKKNPSGPNDYVTEDVLLNGQGQPLDSGWVLANSAIAVPSPQNFSGLRRTYAVRDASGKVTCVKLIFDRYPYIDFSPLKLSS